MIHLVHRIEDLELESRHKDEKIKVFRRKLQLVRKRKLSKGRTIYWREEEKLGGEGKGSVTWWRGRRVGRSANGCDLWGEWFNHQKRQLKKKCVSTQPKSLQEGIDQDNLIGDNFTCGGNPSSGGGGRGREVINV